MLAGELVGEAGGDGDAEQLALIGLDHANDPEDHGHEPEGEMQQSQNSEHAHAAEDRAEVEEDQKDADDLQAAESDDGLGGVKADERPLVDEEKNQASDPAKDVAEQAGYVFLHTSGRSAGGRGVNGRGCGR